MSNAAHAPFFGRRRFEQQLKRFTAQPTLAQLRAQKLAAHYLEGAGDA